MSLTPHGPGFSFLDSFEVTEENGCQQGLGRKRLDPALPFFADHFPGRPLMPAVLLIECAAQAAGALWAHLLGDATPRPFTLAQVVQFKVLRPVLPGETVESRVRLEKNFGELAQFEAALRVGAIEVALGKIVLAK